MFLTNTISCSVHWASNCVTVISHINWAGACDNRQQEYTEKKK